MAGIAAAILNRLIQNAVGPKQPRRHLKPTASQIIAHVTAGDLRGVIPLLATADHPLPANAYARLLQLCAEHRDIAAARRVECHLVASLQPHPPTFLLNRAIETFSLCGSLRDARDLFDEMPRRDGGSWNAIISAYHRSNRPSDVLSMFSQMSKNSSIRPNDVTFACVLGSCTDLLALSLTRQVHGLLVKFGFCSNVILGTAIVDIYGKCWVVSEMRRMFEEIEKPNAISWNVIVRRYLEVDRGAEAIRMFFCMARTDVRPLNFTVSNVLMACSDIVALKEGCQIHGIATKIGLEGDQIVASSLMEMYAKCGVLQDAHLIFDHLTVKDVVSWTSILSGYATCGRTDEARKLFDDMPTRNVISWNAMLTGYVRFCHWDEALDFIFRMQKEGQEVDVVTLCLILNVCAGLFDVELGKQVHGFACRHSFCSDLSLCNAILDVYGKCGSLRTAELWFSNMVPPHDKISWNALISGYANHGRSEEALSAFSLMQQEITPDEFTFSTVLAACANIFVLDHGKQIHGYMIRNGFDIDVIIRGALVDMYSKCRIIEYAVKAFEEEKTRDIILWNSVILGCAYNGIGEYCLDLFEAMQKDGIRPNNVTFIGVLLACISEGYVSLGRRYFEAMSEEYGVIPRIEHYECMIDLLGRYSFMVELEEFIEKMPFDPTIQMWTRIFDWCRQHGNSKLGERATRFINESNPLNPVSFEILTVSDLNT